MTISTFLLPLVNVPQVFTISLVGVTYTLTSKWNDMAQSWYLDIADASQNPIACGLPFITGADLLDGLAYLGIDGSFIVYTDGDATAVPTLANLGIESNLYFQTTAASNG
jgi:hypothetical protein